jgi:hypothetical protein
MTLKYLNLSLLTCNLLQIFLDCHFLYLCLIAQDISNIRSTTIITILFYQYNLSGNFLHVSLELKKYCVAIDDNTEKNGQNQLFQISGN